MYISNLLIRNFRSIEKQNIIFKPGKNVLVGKNNAGKSNIVKALDLVLGEKHPVYTDINEKDFFTYKDNGKYISKKIFLIAVKLEGKDINRELLQSVNSISRAPVGDTNALTEFFENDRQNNLGSLIGDFDSLVSREYIKEKDKLYEMFYKAEELYIYLCVSKKEAMAKIPFEMDNQQKNYDKTYSILLKNDGTYYRCSKFSNDLRDSLITSAILPAIRDVTRQLKINTWSWYGKLIKDLWENCDSYKKKQIATKLDEIKSITNEIFVNATSNIKEKLKKAIYHNDISFQLLQNTKDDIYKGINIFVDDGIEGLLEDKGTGIQSALTIALFSYYCDKFHKNSSLLVVEEPEIFLHPQARRVISCKFDEFVNLDSKNRNQVIITTHSSEFIRNIPLENIIVVRKNGGKTYTSRIIIEPERDKDLIKIQNIISTKNAEIFFADKVILVEGAEEYLIPLIADEYKNESCILDNSNISVAKVGGKSLFKPYMQLLSCMGIEYYVIADFDILEEGLEQLNSFIINFDREELNDIRKSFSELLSNGSEWKKNSKIKPVLFEPEKSCDAKEFCNIMDKVCSEEQYSEELGSIWNYLRPKVRRKVTYDMLKQNESLKNKVFDYIDRLKESNIFILKKGELEDYLTPSGKKIIEESGFAGQKELKIIKLVESISNQEIKLRDVIDVDEYLEAIIKVFED
ncbi:chromosome segregation protein SMC [Thermoanaerobacterium thermosaccharolyticum]|uniref:Uncharacterized protein n=1 Tax=Thermoanaerobacterium thermosaccharolyticum M0795 TaxID=698948 RepID=L0IH76_THETR|nr:ATP-dependent endonuclease [Thermoanaerobacterium thermosaccharolyticum]AGB18198.1 hypothetical protein Thethe_00497 [Thermoanaerobacterium thermosaccharolyticum M0795]MDK2807193.1 putative ATP-dependent endonuclease of the family [Thermoanaerobacterium sp.]PHO06615.1 chromosome segregation protein SMC [Thermoanaerobacterium thermosaccharolyticum]